VVGIIGPNGAGKSSIIEAVAWALYGNPVARSGKDEIKSAFAGAADNCEASLDFEVGGEHYRAVRRLVGKSERAEATLSRNGRPEAVGSTETIRRVTELLGLDRRGFLTSFLARQQELNALADLPPAQRRDHLAGMLGIEKLDRALQQIKDDGRLLGQKSGLLQKQMDQKDAISTRLKELQEHVNRLEYQLTIRSGAYQAARQESEKVELKYREHQEKQAACSQLSGRIEGSLATREHVREQLETLRTREAELLAAGEELARLRPQVADLDRVKKQLEELKAAGQKSHIRSDLAGRIEATRNDSKTAEEKLTGQQSELKAIQVELAKIPTDISQRHQEAVTALERTRQEWTESRGDLKAVEQQTQKLRAQIESMSEIGPDTVCDRCRRPFGKDLATIREHLQRELETLIKTEQDCRHAIQAKLEEGEAQKDRTLQMEGQSRQHYELTIKKESLLREMQNLQERLKSLAEDTSRLEARLRELGEVSFDPEQLNEVEKQVTHLDQVNACVQRLEGQVSDLPATKQGVEKAASQLSDLEAQIARLEIERNNIGWDEAEFTRVKQQFTTLQEKLETAREDWRQTESELGIFKKEQQLRLEELSRLDAVAEELEECRTDHFYLEKLGGLITDFRKFMIGGIRPRLARLSSDLMAEMSGGKYSFVELDNDYNLRVMDYGQYYGIDRFSGGEKDLASLCLRLAISLALTEAAGLDRSFVILDEVFGSQDSDRRELIFQALANLKGRFPQMLLITHLDELKHKVETLVEIMPTVGGWSEVRVNGNLG
jgi:exonuclease SbcC